jgi:hypothetical protein
MRNKHATKNDGLHFGVKNHLERKDKTVTQTTPKEDRTGVLASYPDVIQFPSNNAAKHFMRTGS